jgi:hypothetical protein
MAATVAPIWLLWLRPASRRGGNPAFAEPSVASVADSKSDGVSSAEAEALVPDERFVSYMEQVWKQARSTTLPRGVTPSPYPEDVRRKGLVPTGAKPLGSSDAPPTQSSAPAAQAEREDSPSAPGRTYVPLARIWLQRPPLSNTAPENLREPRPPER